MSAQPTEKKTAAERKEQSAQQIAEAIGKLNAQQTEAIAGMLEALVNELPHTPEGDKINIAISKLSDNRITIALDNGNRPKTTHYEKIVLGACRKAHIESLLGGREFDFAVIKKKLYRQIVRKNEDDTLEAAKNRTRKTHEIYRHYYNRLLKMRQSYHSSQELSDLREKYDNVNIFEFAELIGVTLEGRRRRTDGNFSEWIELAVRILLGDDAYSGRSKPAK
jgi:hypothetical protein